MLPYKFRFTVTNSCGQTLAANAVKVYYRLKRLNANKHNQSEACEGQNFSAETTLNVNTATLDTATTVSSAWIGHQNFTAGDFLVSVTSPTSASGNVVIYIDKCLEDTVTTHFDDAASSAAVLTFAMTGVQTKIKYLEL